MHRSSMNKAMKSFRLSERTNRQMSLLAGKLGINHTDVVEMAVERLASEHLPESGDTPRPAILTTNAGLAEEYDQVASIVEGDPDSPQAYKDSVSRLMRGTAKMLRGEN